MSSPGDPGGCRMDRLRAGNRERACRQGATGAPSPRPSAGSGRLPLGGARGTPPPAGPEEIAGDNTTPAAVPEWLPPVVATGGAGEAADAPTAVDNAAIGGASPAVDNAAADASPAVDNAAIGAAKAVAPRRARRRRRGGDPTPLPGPTPPRNPNRRLPPPSRNRPPRRFRHPRRRTVPERPSRGGRKAPRNWFTGSISSASRWGTPDSDTRERS